MTREPMSVSHLAFEFSAGDRAAVRRFNRHRFNLLLVGMVGLLFTAWLVLQLVWAPSHDRNSPLFALWAAGCALIFSMSGFLCVAGLRLAHRLAADVRQGQVTVEPFRFICAGTQLATWQSRTRRLTCLVSLVPWSPDRGDEAMLRYLPRSGVVLGVARIQPKVGDFESAARVGARVVGVGLLLWVVKRLAGGPSAT